MIETENSHPGHGTRIALSCARKAVAGNPERKFTATAFRIALGFVTIGFATLPPYGSGISREQFNRSGPYRQCGS